MQVLGKMFPNSFAPEFNYAQFRNNSAFPNEVIIGNIAIGVLAIVGNVLLFLVLLLCKELQTNTNILIAALTSVDFFTGVVFLSFSLIRFMDHYMFHSLLLISVVFGMFSGQGSFFTLLFVLTDSSVFATLCITRGGSQGNILFQCLLSYTSTVP